MYSLKKLAPYLCGKKLRLGGPSDGGYVIPASCLPRTKLLLSFGVAAEWSFEEDFYRRGESLKIMMFDYSISMPLILWKMAGKSVKLEMRKAAHYLGAAVKFVRFIMLRPDVTFFKKFLAGRPSDRDVTLDGLFGSLDRSSLEPHGVFIKMDIEGSEYDVLEGVLEHAGLINGMALEFHDLQSRGGRMEEVVARLGKKFYVAHVHGNNYTGLIPGTNLPLSLEVSFINRELVEGTPLHDTGDYPVRDLDHPNDPTMEDYRLDFS